MNKQSRKMLKQVIGALSHMTEIDEEAKAAIETEIIRISKGIKKNGKNAVDVEKEHGSSES